MRYLKPVIPATWEVELGASQPRTGQWKKTKKPYLKNN
jgi:hypothetical protein